jgi:hypothetical protein
MRERLRKVPQETFRPRFVLFREQPDVVAQPEKSIEEDAGFVVSIELNIDVSKPEAAWKEYAFSGRQSVDRAGDVGAITSNETIDQELSLDRPHGSRDPRIARG